MANLQAYSSIQAVIEAWWKEQRPVGDNSPAPPDLSIYHEILEFTQKKLKTSRAMTANTGGGETSNTAVTAGDSVFHVVLADDPPVYEAQTATSRKETAATVSVATTKRDTPGLPALLPVDTPFTCGGFYDYVGANDSNTYGLSGRNPDAVACELSMTSTGRISGTSKDSCGQATIDGTIDCEMDTVELAKHYSWCN